MNSNGFSAADMSTAAANGHRDGYQAGYSDAVKAYETGAAQELVVSNNQPETIDNEVCPSHMGNKPAAAQEAVAEVIEQLADDVDSCVSNACGYLASDSGWDDYGIYRDDAAARYRALPDRIRALAAPVAAATADGLHLAVIGRTHFGNPIPQEWYAAARELLAITPAAPGIDTGNLISSMQSMRDRMMAALVPKFGEAFDGDFDTMLEAISVLKRIDASPKGGSTDAEPMFYIQDTRSFVGNCPVWWGPNGNGYVTRLDEAGRFTEQEAIAQNRTRDTDVPWPCAEIDKLGRITVDVQHMRPRRERLAELQATSAEVGS